MQGSKKEQPQRGDAGAASGGSGTVAPLVRDDNGSRFEKGVQPASKPDRSAKLLQKALFRTH